MRLTKTLTMGVAVALVAAAAFGETLRVKSSANLRHGTSYETRVIGTLEAGTTLEPLGRTGDWYRVALPDGEPAYVHASTVEVVSSAPALPPPARVHQPPSVATPPEPPPEPLAAKRTRFKLLADGVYELSLDLQEARTFEEFVEQATLDNRYGFDAGPGVYAALQYEFVRALGIRAAFGYAKRTGSAQFQGRFPHPLFFEKYREASGELSDVAFKETSGHLDLVYTAEAGRIDISLFGGGSMLKVDADLIDSVQKTEAYPYDTVSIASVTRTTVSDTPFGFNVGAGLDFRLNDKVALGAQFMFSRAVARFEAAPGGALEVDAGGGHATGGVRISF